VGEVGGGETFERHPERDVLDDSSGKVEVEGLLLQRPVERRLRGQVAGDLDAELQGP
jgi:hypothetical protein